MGAAVCFLALVGVVRRTNIDMPKISSDTRRTQFTWYAPRIFPPVSYLGPAWLGRSLSWTSIRTKRSVWEAPRRNEEFGATDSLIRTKLFGRRGLPARTLSFPSPLRAFFLDAPPDQGLRELIQHAPPDDAADGTLSRMMYCTPVLPLALFRSSSSSRRQSTR